MARPAKPPTTKKPTRAQVKKLVSKWLDTDSGIEDAFAELFLELSDRTLRRDDITALNAKKHILSELAGLRDSRIQAEQIEKLKQELAETRALIERNKAGASAAFPEDLALPIAPGRGASDSN